MMNPMRYIKDLEAAGFDRNQAEAQVQMVIDMVQSDLMTKSDFSLFQEKIDHRFIQMEERFVRVDNQFRELEYRVVLRLGLLMVSSLSVAVAVLAWLIKI